MIPFIHYLFSWVIPLSSYTLQEIASEHGIAPSQISRWVDDFKYSGAEVFSKDNKSAKRMELLEAEQNELYAKIGKLTASNDWLKKKLEKLGG